MVNKNCIMQEKMRLVYILKSNTYETQSNTSTVPCLENVMTLAPLSRVEPQTLT